MTEKSLISSIKDANDLVKLVTGKSIPDLAKRMGELFGRDVARKIVKEEPPPEPDSPYAVLGVRKDASNLVIQTSYRSLRKGTKQGTPEYEKLHQAYLQILHDRGEG